MKKVLNVIAIVVSIIIVNGTFCIGSNNPGSCNSELNNNYTWSESFNQQFQTQDFINVDGGSNGMISMTTQDQTGNGWSNSVDGSGAWEGQEQGELIKINFDNGYTEHNYNQGGLTYGKTDIEDWSKADHFEMQSINSGIGTLGDGHGRFSISGMSVSVIANVKTNSLEHNGYSETNAGTISGYENGYSYNNNGITSNIVQNGFQSGQYTTDVYIKTVDGYGNYINNASINAQQVGGTVAHNNGNGTSMSGVGIAEGSVSVSSKTSGCGACNIHSNIVDVSAEQVQQHSYSQNSFNHSTGQTQWANGTVGTYNKALVHITN
jgi:hypothetical protein